MNRLVAAMVVILYAAGGTVMGYYSHALRVSGELTNLVDYGLAAGGILFLLAMLLHFGEVRRARTEDTKHMEKEESLTKQITEDNIIQSDLERRLLEDAKVMEFCQVAIGGAAEEALRKNLIPDFDDFVAAEEKGFVKKGNGFVMEGDLKDLDQREHGISDEVNEVLDSVRDRAKKYSTNKII